MVTKLARELCFPATTPEIKRVSREAWNKIKIKMRPAGRTIITLFMPRKSLYSRCFRDTPSAGYFDDTGLSVALVAVACYSKGAKQLFPFIIESPYGKDMCVFIGKNARSIRMYPFGGTMGTVWRQQSCCVFRGVAHCCATFYT